MIFVSGTKRSGTSMWMQVLAAGGFPVLGKAFPRNWGKTLRDLNPEGFFESILRHGIYYRTNPHPASGKYFLPEEVDGYVVKVFVPGVIRSERAYITHLVANVREWREYEASMERLYETEAQAQAESKAQAPAHKPFRFPAAFEWWMENFALVRDISLRRYAARLQAYDQVLDDPQGRVAATLEWIGQGDVEKAVAAVKPEHRTQTRPESNTVEPRLAQVFDDLYGAVAESKGFSKALLSTLNATNKELLPLLTKLQHKVVESAPKRPKRKAEDVSGLPPIGS